MPQLMPLNWMISSMMILLLVVSCNLIYSVSTNKNIMKEQKNSDWGMKMMWCW